MAKKKKLEERVDPFLAIAQGISEERTDQVYKENPVDIVEFIESPKYLNQKFNGRTGCRPAILDIAVEVVNPKIREVILLLGKGSGKDFISAIIHLYGIYKSLCMVNPQSFYGLAPAPIYFVNTARNETQAKRVFFTQFKALLTECPWFEGKYREPGAQSVEFDKNVHALSVNSQAYGWLGFNTIQWVGDELAFFLESDKDEESESRSRECWEAAFGSCKTRFPMDYKMIGITTPRYDDDFVMNKFYELKDREEGYTKQAATWDIHPALTKADFKHEFIRDHRRAMRDFGAQPSGVIESFWPDPDMVENFVCEECRQCPIYQNRQMNDDTYACWAYDKCRATAYRGNGEWADWFRPNPDHEYYMHFDLAKNKDRVGFSLSHSIGEMTIELDSYILKEKYGDTDSLTEEDRFEKKPIIKIDAVGWISVKNPEWHKGLLKNGEFYYPGIFNKLVLALHNRGFNLAFISFDQYQSIYIKQLIEDQGIESDLLSLDRTDEVPSAAKFAVTEQRVEYPYCKVLCTEAKYLKYIKGKKVDHIKGLTKDIWDGFAGTIFNCEKFAQNTGDFEILGDYDDD